MLSYHINDIKIKSSSMMPAKSSTLEKIDNLATSTTTCMGPSGMMRHQMHPQGMGPYGEDHGILVDITTSKITITKNGAEHYYILNNGKWEYTRERSHYTEDASLYATMLCNEIIEECK